MTVIHSTCLTHSGCAAGPEEVVGGGINSAFNRCEYVTSIVFMILNRAGRRSTTVSKSVHSSAEWVLTNTWVGRI